METVALAFTGSWASGVNCYLTVLILALADKLWPSQTIPDLLSHPGVLAAATLLYALEFFADKIPYVDSSWDAVSTFIRPLVAAGLAALIAGEAETVNQAISAALGGVTGLASHTAKASFRLAVNTSPEPASNIITSTLEDITVLGVLALAVTYPYVAAGIAGALLVMGLIAAWVSWKLAKKGIAKLKERRAAHSSSKRTSTP